MSRRFFAYSLLIVTAMLLWGCDSDPAASILGSWRADTKSDFDGKPIVLTLTDKKLKMHDLDETGVVYEADADKINIKNAAHGHVMMVASEIEKNSVVFDQGSAGGKDRYTRITEEEAKIILQGRAEKKSSVIWR